MKNKFKLFIQNMLIVTVGNLLVFLMPNKARQLSETRMTLVHKKKKDLSLTERLMRVTLLRKLDNIDDHNAIAKINRDFWTNKAPEFFLEKKDSFETDFLPNCAYVFDLLKKELVNHVENFHTLVEIGVGGGYVLEYLSSELTTVNRFVGIDLSKDQITINKKKYCKNSKLEFIAGDAFDWVEEKGECNTIFVTSRGVLEYFVEPRLLEFLNKINQLGKVIFIAIEPNGKYHDFEKSPNSQLYGQEPSFSHNYPYLFKNAGFSFWHFKQKPWNGGEVIRTIIGAKN